MFSLTKKCSNHVSFCFYFIKAADKLGNSDTELGLEKSDDATATFYRRRLVKNKRKFVIRGPWFADGASMYIISQTNHNMVKQLTCNKKESLFDV